ncbi:DUF4232 domain-containing protein [Pseudonocardia abyssalis]|jgi:hypothetical protein|uniref:DUF4232 domain-containing protein n=1 Tax=Pseudonocardia abyssalis TaxID=2792008 RepID=A0ABS6UPC6_9PSEU|nr:DUF4232 domain-containing protein [Pseudonocardia abyssalis]MBW0117632.1 DUF4232 domain-containing protein [Pseudonocardia abyssalis]MBW0134110.1 DUF4232 domain-containing protein [Pseudonocardia abyssalis]
MIRTRSLLTVVAAAALLAGCSGPQATTPDGPVIGTSAAPTSTAAPATTATAPVADTGGGGGGDPERCTTGELTGSLADGDAAAGSRFVTLVLTNTGTRTCELTGFPGVSYVAGDDGHQVGPAAAMDGPRGGEVRLAVGAAAGAQVRMVNVANYDAAACSPTPVRGLRVYPPGDTASLFVPMDGTGCAGTPPGEQLTVQTLAAR